MKPLSRILQAGAYGSSLLLVGSIPGLSVTLSDTTLGSINRLIGGGVVLLWLLSTTAAGRMRTIILFHWLTLTFAVWYVISLWWSVAPDDTPFLFNMVQGAALTVMLWDLYRTRPRVEAAMQAFLLGGCVSVATTAWNFAQGNQARHWEKRFAASGFDPNDIALTVAIGIPFAAYLATRAAKPGFLRALNFLYPVAAGFVIVLSGSRGAMIAALPAYLYYIASVAHMSRGWRLAALAVLIAVVGGTARLDLSEPLQRLGTVTNSASGDHLSGRSDLWQAGWSVYGQHPFLGVGGGAFAAATRPLTGLGESLIAHNTYLSVLTELGPFGILVFAALLAAVAASAPRRPDPLRTACLLALLVWMIGVFALSWEFRSQTWLLFTLIVAAGHCASAAPDQQNDLLQPVRSVWAARRTPATRSEGRQ